MCKQMSSNNSIKVNLPTNSSLKTHTHKHAHTHTHTHTHIYIYIYIYKQDFALINAHGLICYKLPTNKK